MSFNLPTLEYSYYTLLTFLLAPSNKLNFPILLHVTFEKTIFSQNFDWLESCYAFMEIFERLKKL